MVVTGVGVIHAYAAVGKLVAPASEAPLGTSLSLHCAAIGLYQTAGSWPRL
jgi:hypothetical protein